jgi:hypothetical protein
MTGTYRTKSSRSMSPRSMSRVSRQSSCMARKALKTVLPTPDPLNERTRSLWATRHKSARQTQTDLVRNRPLIGFMMRGIVCATRIHPRTRKCVKHPAHCLRCLVFSKCTHRWGDYGCINSKGANPSPPTDTSVPQLDRPVGFRIVSEKFYTVDDFNTHITKFNKMVIVWYLASS